MTAIADLPDIRPSLLLDFANSGRVDPRIECTRASSATCFGPDGKLRTVPANVPRIDYDPATGKCLGLLVEEARRNLLRQPSMLSDTAWVKSDVLVKPSDTQNALGLDFIKLTPISGTYKTINQALSTAISDNQIVTFSVFAKAGEMNTIRLGFRDKANYITAGHFNLLTGEASRQEITGKYLGDGWWRVALSGTDVSSGSAKPLVHIYSINNGDVTTPGDGVSGLYIAAPQLELGAYATSYIPTEGTAVTRAADAVSIALTLSGGGGALVMSGSVAASAPNSFMFPVRARGVGLPSAYIGVPYVVVGGTFVSRNGYLRNAGSAKSVAVPGAAIPFSEIFKAVISWDASTMRVGINGASVTVGHSQDAPDCTHIDLMTATHGGSVLGAGHVARVAAYNALLTTTQVQRLTA
nr:MAG TPA: hypothetical protein [Caudoviricetes sp.]